MEKNKSLLFLTTILSLIPCMGFIILLVVWFTKKDTLVGEERDYLKNLTNFELLMFIISIVCGAVLPILLGLVGIFTLVVIILATISVYNGKNYKFPINLEMLK